MVKKPAIIISLVQKTESEQKDAERVQSGADDEQFIRSKWYWYYGDDGIDIDLLVQQIKLKDDLDRISYCLLQR